MKAVGTRSDYPCSKCKTRHLEHELDDENGLCRTCRGDGPRVISKRRCEICGIAIAGYSNRKTCGPAHKKTRQRRIAAGESLPHEQAA